MTKFRSDPKAAMTDTAPIVARYEGEGAWSAPSPRWGKRADEIYVIGQDYLMAEAHNRSQKSHDHFFASLTESWKNLPETIAERFPTADHLRKYALIRAGFCDTHTLSCNSAAEARKVARFMEPIDEFSIIIATAATVTRYTAKSQSLRAMGKDEFQRSKDAVLEIVSSLIGTTPAELSKAAD